MKEKKKKKVYRLVRALKDYKRAVCKGIQRQWPLYQKDPITKTTHTTFVYSIDKLFIDSIKKGIKAIPEEVIDITTNNEKRLIHYVAEILPEMLPVVLEKNANPNAKDYKNLTAAHILLYYLLHDETNKLIIKVGRKNIIKQLEQLLQKGVDPNIKIKEVRHDCKYATMVGKTLFEIAKDNREITSILRYYYRKNKKEINGTEK